MNITMVTGTTNRVQGPASRKFPVKAKMTPGKKKAEYEISTNGKRKLTPTP
jgi:hypothetical protein